MSFNKLCVKYLLPQLKLELYINAWRVAGEYIEQCVSADKVDDPLDKVV